MKKILIFLCLNLFLYSNEYKIGVVLPLTGASAAYGQSALNGIKLANSMQGSLDNGDKIVLSVVDTKGDKLESYSSSLRLVSNEKVLGLIGEMLTANTLQVMRVAEEKEIPLIAPAATSDRILDKKNFSSRVCFNDSFQGESLAKYAFDKLNYKKVAIIMDQSADYSLGLAKAFENEFKKRGGDILNTFKINSGDKDFKTLIAQLKNLNIDFIYLPLYYNEAALFVRQARNLKLNTPMGSADGVADKTFINLTGDTSKGHIFTDSFDYNNPSTDLAKEFIKNYKGEVPNFTAMGADAYFVMIRAMNNCLSNLSPKCINDEIHKTNFEGVTGKISIDKSGNAKRSVVIKEINNQSQIYKDTINP
ncbi:ABC transporter substrate-binding protein [Campylobacter sp. LR185c]|uniref:ABC transporter substrate-binding protein n=1 Tax=Campylobacter sp. LR185c TaxID=2014525 RepID=UPI001237B751|nr:ABC transporter substrate-binding protein [Campylobacter sp. LR185c]KAA6225393.1 ABC transporter substrate-binding protein [Campylobacter sp. LR185c]KAA8604916.1 branched-chain amino acid ABC transporter substrate-binding protein [Campylobacter sp. LR185c]